MRILIPRQNRIEIIESGLSEGLKVISGEGANELDRPALRGETALLIDKAPDPFNNCEVDLNGEFRRLP